MKKLKNLLSSENYDTVQHIIVNYGLKILYAIALLVIGFWIIKTIIKVFKKIMTKKNIDQSLSGFISDLMNWGLKILLVITVLSQLGIETTSFVAILGAAGLAVGLALQGTLSNFAGGALIMIFKPFKTGDLIEAQGHIGSVKEIQIFVTKIITPGNKLAIIPNGILSNGTIKNYTAEG